MENQVYNWIVKNGNVIVQKNGDYVSLQLGFEHGDYCLLTYSDAAEIIDILANISAEIWENPAYKKTPYTSRLYTVIENKYYWKIESSELSLKYNDIKEGIEIKCTGSSKLNVEINNVAEIIQIMEHLLKEYP